MIEMLETCDRLWRLYILIFKIQNAQKYFIREYTICKELLIIKGLWFIRLRGAMQDFESFLIRPEYLELENAHLGSMTEHFDIKD